jgi:dipeptidyl aminopeptidase/acylaminoacyl peptidase
MSEDRLRSLLREAQVPGAEGAERRGLAMVEAAFAERRRAERPALPRLALALAIATLLGALLLSPAGAAVRGWVDDVFTAGVPDAEPSLTEIPGGGRLLVQSPAGPWVVQPDGARRLLGDYRQAAWSPRGLFVATAAGRTLSAVEPGGTPRWSISAPAPVSDPRWSPSGFRIAYRAGAQLRVTAADGTGDALLARRVEAVPPAWSARGLPLLAYVDAGGRLRIANSESAETIGSAPALARIADLEWAPDDSALLESSPHRLRLRPLTVRKLVARIGIGPPREVPLPGGARVRDAALSPDGDTVAALLTISSGGGPRSTVVLAGTHGGPRRVLFRTPGRLSELAWSPDGGRLLIAWPDADQWLFIPASGRTRVRAIGGVAGQFAPGGRDAAFPRIDGWCCAANARGG